RVGVLPPPLVDAKTLAAEGGADLGYTVATGFSGNRPELQAKAAAAGHLSPGLDFDGETRRVPMLLRFEGGYYESLSLALARTYLGNVPATVRIESSGSGKDAFAWVSSLQV